MLPHLHPAAPHGNAESLHPLAGSLSASALDTGVMVAALDLRGSRLAGTGSGLKVQVETVHTSMSPAASPEARK